MGGGEEGLCEVPDGGDEDGIVELDQVSEVLLPGFGGGRGGGEGGRWECGARPEGPLLPRPPSPQQNAAVDGGAGLGLVAVLGEDGVERDVQLEDLGGGVQAGQEYLVQVAAAEEGGLSLDDPLHQAPRPLLPPLLHAQTLAQVQQSHARQVVDL